MFPYQRRDERTDRERYLEDELEREREAARSREQRESEAREQRRKQCREEMEYEYRQARSWPEAFSKQAVLCWREDNNFPDDDPFFKESALGNEAALQIWKDVAASKEAELEELQKRIDAIWDAVRLEVADRLEKCNDSREWKNIASAIREDELEDYLDW